MSSNAYSRARDDTRTTLLLKRTLRDRHTRLTVEAVRHALWFFGEEDGWRPGSFTDSLLSAISRADPTNRYRLSLGFPAEVEAYMIGAEYPEGIGLLREYLERQELMNRKRNKNE